MKQTHISRAGRLAQIVMHIYEQTAEAQSVIFTPYAIAKGIGLKPSTHATKLVRELIETGWLNEQEAVDMFGRKTTQVWLTGDAFKLIEDAYADGKASLRFVKEWFEQ